MPASGSIAIISAPQTCGSICAAVGIASGSLCTLSLSAARPTPYCMRNFYGFSTDKCIYLSVISQSGTFGVSGSVCGVYCVNRNPAMSAGQCFTINFTGSLGTINQPAGSCAFILVYCNGTNVGGCSITTAACCNSISLPASGSWTVTNATSMCVVLCALTLNTACPACSQAAININTVTPVVGGFCRDIPFSCNAFTG